MRRFLRSPQAGHSAKERPTDVPPREGPAARAPVLVRARPDTLRGERTRARCRSGEIAGRGAPGREEGLREERERKRSAGRDPASRRSRARSRRPRDRQAGSRPAVAEPEPWKERAAAETGYGKGSVRILPAAALRVQVAARRIHRKRLHPYCNPTLPSYHPMLPRAAPRSPASRGVQPWLGAWCERPLSTSSESFLKAGSDRSTDPFVSQTIWAARGRGQLPFPNPALRRSSRPRWLESTNPSSSARGRK